MTKSNKNMSVHLETALSSDTYQHKSKDNQTARKQLMNQPNRRLAGKQNQKSMYRPRTTGNIQSVKLMIMLLASKCEARLQSVFGKKAEGVP